MDERKMKKLWILVLLPLLLFTACDDGTYKGEDLCKKVKLEVEIVRQDDGVKRLSVDYPVIGGLTNMETINKINESISTYVWRQIYDFNTAIDNKNQAMDMSIVVVPEESQTDVEGEIPDVDENSAEDDSLEDNVDENSSGDVDAGEETPVDDGSGEDANAENQGQLDAGGETMTDQGTTPTDGETPSYLDMHFKVTWNKHNILNIVESYEQVIDETDQFAGMFSFIFDISAGKALTLGDIYDFESKFPSVINEGIEAQIGQDRELVTYEGSDGFNGISKDVNFYLDDENLYIFYDPLEISPDKAAMPTFTFQLKKLTPYLTKEFQGRV